MSLSDANLAKIRNVYQRDFLELPLAKDLPRLAKFISICDEDGVRLSYKENQPLDIDHYLQEKGPDFLIFYQVRRVLLTLTLALEGPNKCVEVDKALLHLLDTHDFLLPEVMNPFLGQHFGDTSKVVRVLKCINQVHLNFPRSRFVLASGGVLTGGAGCHCSQFDRAQDGHGRGKYDERCGGHMAHFRSARVGFSAGLSHQEGSVHSEPFYFGMEITIFVVLSSNGSTTRHFF